MRRRLAVLVALLACACASPPEAARPGAAPPAASGGIGTLAPPFRDYRVGTRGPGGVACRPAGAAVRYVQSLEYLGGPPVVFGLDAEGCVGEIRYDAGRFEHAAALATQRLGPPSGEDRARCAATDEALQSLFWNRPEGRFEVVRVGSAGPAAFVLRPADAPFTYGRLCEGEVVR